MVTVPRYIVERGPDQVRTAFRRIVSICRDRRITRVTLVVPQKGGWDRTIVAAFLGQPAAKALLKGQPVRLVEGVTMMLESSQTFRGTSGQGLLVGAHISGKDMNKLDDA